MAFLRLRSPAKLSLAAAFAFQLTGPVAADTWFVDADAAAGGTGESWLSAFRFLQDALEAAQQFDEIWVAEGTYYPPDGLDVPPPDPRYASFGLKRHVEIYGGFAGNEELRIQRNPQKNITVLSGDIDGNGLRDDGNSIHVVTAVSQSGSGFLDGFRIRLGNTHSTGGGLHVYYATPTIQRCTFVNNGGSGVWCALGVAEFPPTARFINCSFIGNGSIRGGGMRVTSNGPIVWLYLNNCLFSGNSSETDGGGLALSSGVIAFVRNCTFSRNTSAFPTAGIDGGPPLPPCASVELHNSILWHNGSPNGFGEEDQIDVSCLDILSATYNCIEGLDTLQGNGNIGDNPLLHDPMFCDADGADDIAGSLDDDLRLRDWSPCIDTGADVEVPKDISDINENGDANEPLPWDLDSVLPQTHWGRFFDVADGPTTPPANVDMGAYENQHICDCPWDIASPGGGPPPDGDVGNPDFLKLLADWGACTGCGADFNCDLTVDADDYSDLIDHWGACPGSCGSGQEGASSDGVGELEVALWVIGFDSVAAYQAWLQEVATDEEVFTTALLLAELLTG
jgi:hypothetical protein